MLLLLQLLFTFIGLSLLLIGLSETSTGILGALLGLFRDSNGSFLRGFAANLGSLLLLRLDYFISCLLLEKLMI